MKIKLVDPKGTRLGLNADLAYLAGSLIREGHDVDVLDLNNCLREVEERLSGIKNADLIGISIKTSTVNEGRKLAEKARRINPEALIICGGVHITIDGVAFLKENRIFDVAVLGDGEDTITEIARGNKLETIDGIIFRSGDEIVVNKKRKMSDLDQLPLPDYQCFDSISVYKTPFPYNYYPIITSRGCPSKCVYCSVPFIYGWRWRSRSPQSVITELRNMQRIFNLKEFAVLDDNFTVDLGRAKEFCRLLIRDKTGLKWQCPGGLKALFTDEELAWLMKRSGAHNVNFGIESAVPEVFEGIGKGGTLKDIAKTIELFKRNGIKVGGTFLIGLPDSTKSLDEKSVSLSMRMNLDNIMWGIVVPYPGTKLFDIIKTDSRYRFMEDWRNGLHCGNDVISVFESDDYPAQERMGMYYYANIRTRFYGNVLNMNDSNIEKAKDLLRFVLKYDALRFFWHIFWILKAVIDGLKNRTVRIGI